MSIEDALANEIHLGMQTLASDEIREGVARFTSGEGRGGV